MIQCALQTAPSQQECAKQLLLKHQLLLLERPSQCVQALVKKKKKRPGSSVTRRGPAAS